MNQSPTGYTVNEISTVGDLCDIIANNLNSTNEELSNWAKTLLGPRTHGSTTSLPLSSVNKNTPVEVFDTPQVKGATCFIFDAPEAMRPTLGALPLLDVIAMGYIDSIATRDGIHGKELYLPGGDDLVQPAKDICVIVGEFQGEQAVFTWHPGKPLAPYNPELGLDFNLMDPATSVKLI
jgi:hypothetical protein